VDASSSALIDLLLYTAQQPLLQRRVDLQLQLGCCSQQLIIEGGECLCCFQQHYIQSCLICLLLSASFRECAATVMSQTRCDLQAASWTRCDI
jgi:hypothetical protein